ncbi:MAG: hypothetical protein ACT4TC_18495 [Myxococcaceae bacterium]
MKLKFIFFTLLLAAGCGVPNDSAIRILNSFALTGETAQDCAASDIAILGGSLDISARSYYALQFTVASGLQSINTTTGGTVVADASRNNFYATEVVLTYSSTPELGIEAETVPLHFVIEPQTDDNFVRMNLISSKAYQALRTGVTPGTTADLRVTVQFRGATQAGQKLSSTSITYPIRVSNSNFAGCTAPQVLKANGACGEGGGQDGVPAVCCTPGTDCD